MKAQRRRVGVGVVGELAQPAGEPPGTGRVGALTVAGALAEQPVDELHGERPGAAAQPDGPEGGDAQHGHAVHGAGVGDDRPARDPQRQVGEDQPQVEAAPQEHLPGGRDDLCVVGRRRHESVLDLLDPPPDAGQPGGQLHAQVLGQHAGELGGSAGRGQQPEDDLRPRRREGFVRGAHVGGGVRSAPGARSVIWGPPLLACDTPGPGVHRCW